MRLFHRNARLTLIKPVVGGGFFARGPNALIINAGTKQGLKLTFKISKALGKEPNSCEINIYNLNENDRHQFSALPLQVQLDVGYDGTLARLFTGDLSFAYTTREDKTSRKTVLQCHDGGRAYNEARISKSYKGPVSALQAVKDTVGSMGLQMPTSIAQAQELKKQFVSGLTLHGKSSQELTTLLKPTHIDWSIQDGQMQMLDAAGVRPDTAFVISQRNGMIDSPEFNAPKKPKEKRVLKVKMLLYNPSLLPGGRIKVESDDVNGLFRIEKIEHSGDTEHADWYSDIEATPIS